MWWPLESIPVCPDAELAVSDNVRYHISTAVTGDAVVIHYVQTIQAPEHIRQAAHPTKQKVGVWLVEAGTELNLGVDRRPPRSTSSAIFKVKVAFIGPT